MPLDNIFNRMRRQRVDQTAVGEMSVREVIRQSDTSIVLDSMVNTGNAQYFDLGNAMRGMLRGQALSTEERKALDQYSKEAAEKAKAAREIQSFLSQGVVEQMISAPGMKDSELALLTRQIGAENVSKLLTSDYFAKMSVENEALFNRFKEARKYYVYANEAVAKIETYTANLAAQWGLPADELKAVLLEAPMKRRAKLQEVFKAHSMGWEGFFDSLGWTGLWSFVTTGKERIGLEKRLIQEYGEAWIDKLNAHIDTRFASTVTQMDAALNVDEETRKKVQAFMLGGRQEDLGVRRQAEFKSASETLSNRERLDGFFKFPAKAMLDRFNDFVREQAYNHNSVNSRQGNRAAVAQRLKVWWDWLPNNVGDTANGQTPQGVNGAPFKSKNEYIGDFIDKYLDFVLKQTGVKGSARWETFTQQQLRDRLVDPAQYDLVNKLMTQLRAPHFEA